MRDLRTNATASALSMPLGGIGTGNVSIHADGSLRQWQLGNTGNHRGYVPNGFFAVRAYRPEPPVDVLRLLQAPPTEPSRPAPLVNDAYVPAGLRRLVEQVPPARGTAMRSTYPFASLGVEDPELPVEIELEAFNPLVPGDVDASELPVALFTVTVSNPSDVPVYGWLAGACQNFVGWDGITSIDGSRCALYGGNVNRVRRRPNGWTQLVMDNPSLPEDHPALGQVVLAADGPGTVAYPRWREPADLVAFLADRRVNPGRMTAAALDAPVDPQRGGPSLAHGPSVPGETWNGALACPFALGAGERVSFRYLLGWHFPNRYVDHDGPGPARDQRHDRFWLGNAYASRFADAVDVAEHAAEQWWELENKSRTWVATLTDSTLPEEVAERAAAQAVPLRSPTCFRASDGRFYGFEGTLGVSTGMALGVHGGSCPLNCNHVWNYEQALSRLFPSLERSMRDTEWERAQAPEGYIPHRVVAPLWRPQLHRVDIGGPDTPALDGMLGAVLKTYRELRLGAGRDWGERHWPRVRELLDYVARQWDGDGDGVLRGRQPTTHDIDLYGVNTYIGSLWLAALRASERLAALLDDPATGSWCRQRFEAGSQGYDEALWNGEYYVQRLDDGDPTEFSYGDGCLADQLFGQWWATQLDLGYLLPAKHVRTALRSIHRFNFRRGFADFHHGYRVFADGDDAGLLLCAWPYGGRPDVPVRYADEVWTGVEYEVAAQFLYEGLHEEGMEILGALWSRYDGSRRNPYNEIECGDHYVRAMAGWSVLEAFTGVTYDAWSGHVRLRPEPHGKYRKVPFVAPTGWGQVVSDAEGITLRCRYGSIDLAGIVLDGIRVDGVDVVLDGAVLPVRPEACEGGVAVTFAELVTLRSGGSLRLRPGDG